MTSHRLLACVGAFGIITSACSSSALPVSGTGGASATGGATTASGGSNGSGTGGFTSTGGTTSTGGFTGTGGAGYGGSRRYGWSHRLRWGGRWRRGHAGSDGRSGTVGRNLCRDARRALACVTTSKATRGEVAMRRGHQSVDEGQDGYRHDDRGR